MGLDRSPERDAENSSNSLCPIRKGEISGVDGYRTACQHEFHKRCIEGHWKKSIQCPVCKSSCRPKVPKVSDNAERETRSQSRNRPLVENIEREVADNTASTSGLNASTNSSGNSNTSVINANAITLLAMERRLLATLSERMAELIQSSVSDIITRVRATQSPMANNSQGERSSQQR